MTDNNNIINEFVKELLADLNIVEGTDEYKHLTDVLGERVVARVFLDIINSLTPEQASLVANDMASAKSDADAVIGRLLDQVPHLQAVIASSLGKIHIEIKNDFANIVANK